MLTYFQAIILGVLQGITELFPISSLGHSVIVPRLLGWHIAQGDNFFIVFLVLTHLATSLVLLAFYWRDWVHIVQGIFRSLWQRRISPDDTYARLGWRIVVSTIPVGILGLLLEEKLKVFFASAELAAFFLILNGLLLWALEIYKKNRTFGMTQNLSQNKALKGEMTEEEFSFSSDTRIAHLTWRQSIGVGCAQCIALIPGFSRTGAALGGGLLVGLTGEDALRYSFLLATPVILAASVLKLSKFVASGNSLLSGPLVAGFIASALAAYISVRFLTSYFKNSTHNLKPFALYCIGFGLLASAIFLIF